MKTLKCDMRKECTAPVTHVDRNGFAYCSSHGALRKAYTPCRKLTASEVRSLEMGQPISYSRKMAS